MEIELQSGMASPLFLTEPDSGTAHILNPTVIVSSQELTIDALAKILSDDFNAGLQKNTFMRLMIQKSKPEDIARYFGLLAEKHNAPVMQVLASSRALFIVTAGIEKICLNALKVMTLRGYGKALVVNLPEQDIEILRVRLRQEFKNELILEDAATVLYKPKKLHVLSAQMKTILSTDRSAKDILKSRQDLRSNLGHYKINKLEEFAN